MTLQDTPGHAYAQEAGVVRADITAMDVMRLVHGIVVSTEQAPDQADRLLSLMLDGLRAELAELFGAARSTVHHAVQRTRTARAHTRSAATVPHPNLPSPGIRRD